MQDLTTRIRTYLTRAGRSTAGAIAAEYVAILFIVSLVVTVVIGLGIDDRVEEKGNEAVNNMFSEEGAGGGGE